MTVEHNHYEDKQWIRNIVFGITAAILFTVLGCALLTAAIQTGRVGESGIQWTKSIIWALSVMIGIFVGPRRCQEKRLLNGTVVAICYLLIALLAGIAVFHQSVAGIGRGVASIGMGWILSILVMGLPTNKKRRKWKYRPG